MDAIDDNHCSFLQFPFDLRNYFSDLARKPYSVKLVNCLRIEARKPYTIH